MSLLSNPMVGTAATFAVLGTLVFFADVISLATGTCKSPKASVKRMSLSGALFTVSVVFLLV